MGKRYLADPAMSAELIKVGVASLSDAERALFLMLQSMLWCFLPDEDGQASPADDLVASQMALKAVSEFKEIGLSFSMQPLSEQEKSAALGAATDKALQFLKSWVDGRPAGDPAAAKLKAEMQAHGIIK